jgi:hypothetical protein
LVFLSPIYFIQFGELTNSKKKAASFNVNFEIISLLVSAIIIGS